MANHGVNAEGKRLPRMAATLMMHFTTEREPTFGIHRASFRPVTPSNEFEDSTGGDSQSTIPELCHFVDTEESTAVKQHSLEDQSLESPPQVEDLVSDPESPSAWSLSSGTGGETSLEVLEDNTDDSLRRNQRTGVKFTDWHKCLITALCTERFDKLLRECLEYQNTKSCFTAFVQEREVLDTGGQRCEEYEVVALGSGQNCCSGWLSYTGSIVHDCHAIVIARRALKRYLYKQLLLFYSTDPELKKRSILESAPSERLLQLKPHIYLHLYTKKAPKGAAQCIVLQSQSSAYSTLKLQCHPKGSLIPSAFLLPSVSPFVSGPGSSSRLCKRALYFCFRKVSALAGHHDFLAFTTYHNAKMAAQLYQETQNSSQYAVLGQQCWTVELQTLGRLLQSLNDRLNKP